MDVKAWPDVAELMFNSFFGITKSGFNVSPSSCKLSSLILRTQTNNFDGTQQFVLTK
jgi:hypothetical protein